jgi:hypothetical protein
MKLTIKIVKMINKISIKVKMYKWDNALINAHMVFIILLIKKGKNNAINA